MVGAYLAVEKSKNGDASDEARTEVQAKRLAAIAMRIVAGGCVASSCVGNCLLVEVEMTDVLVRVGDLVEWLDGGRFWVCLKPGSCMAA